jgi:hypothetical protein
MEDLNMSTQDFATVIAILFGESAHSSQAALATVTRNIDG